MTGNTYDSHCTAVNLNFHYPFSPFFFFSRPLEEHCIVKRFCNKKLKNHSALSPEDADQVVPPECYNLYDDYVKNLGAMPVCAENTKCECLSGVDSVTRDSRESTQG